MLKNVLFFIFFSSNINNVFSQGLTLQYVYRNDGYFKDSFYFPLSKPIDKNARSKTLEILPLTASFSKYDTILKSTFSYSINDTIIATLGDAWGHQVILIPGSDTLIIDFRNKIESNPYSKDSLLIPWNYRYGYTSKFKTIYQLFDSLDVSAGSPHFDKIGFKNIDSGINFFFAKCNRKYEKRIAFLNEYCLKNNIPDEIRKIAYQEIKSAYLLNLMQAIIPGITKFNKEDLPKSFLDSLGAASFKDDALFRRTKSYSKAAYQYAIFFLSKQNRDFKDKIDFANSYQTIKQAYKGDIRDYCLTNLLTYFVKTDQTKFDSLFNDFKKYCSDTNAIVYLDSIQNFSAIKSKISFSQALKTSIYNYNQVQAMISDKFNGKPILIDCWASWCKPCLLEMPYSKMLQKRFKGKVDFIYLSFDKNNRDWIKKSNELGLTNTYLIKNEFENNFSWHFNISSIPRYIIIDKNKKLINADSPRPSEVKELTQILNKAIKE